MIDGKLKPGDGERLVNASIKRTRHILRWISTRRNFRLQHLGLELEDIAYDMIAELFAAEEEECCHRFRRAMLAMGGLESDDELLSAFESILFKNVQQQSSRIFGEINPLHQHLNYCLKSHVLRNHAVQIHTTFDGRWFYRGTVENARLHLPAMPLEELRQHIHFHGSETRSNVIGVLEAVLDVLEGQERYRRAVLEPDIISISKDIVRLDFKGSAVQHDEMTTTHDTKVLVHILYQSLDECKPWLENTYLRTKRLTEQELDLFLEAIRLYFMDIMQGEDSQGSYSYLRRCMPGLTHTRFRQTYRRRFEYILARIMETARAHLGSEEAFLR